MEGEPDEEAEASDEVDAENDVLRFVIRGIGYSLQQNIIPRDEVVRKLHEWYPDVDIKPNLKELDE